MNRCSNCQSEVQVGQKFCTNCGLVLVEETPAEKVREPADVSRQTRPLADTSVPPDLDDRTPDYQVESDEVEVADPDLAQDLELLPDGAVIGEEYVVNRVITEQQHLNQYHVDRINSAGNYISSHILKESDDWRIFGIALDLAGLNLLDRGLLLPDCVFQQTFSGLTRYYLVLPKESLAPTKIQEPVDIVSALNWGALLATGLATLHQRQIAFGLLAKENIVLDGQEAYLADFVGCLQPGQQQQYYEDVRQLAVVLYELMTGSQQYDPQAALPVRLRKIFANVMTLQQPVSGAEFSLLLSEEAERIVGSESLDFRTGRMTDVGAVRELNEDSLLTMELFRNNQSAGKPLGVFVVADGMGGHEGGEIASGLTIEVVTQKIFEELKEFERGENAFPDPDGWLSEAVLAANTKVHEQSKSAGNEMGTTVVIALMIGEMVYIAHVGDSRAYHITASSIESITTDHSLVATMVASGQISAEEARFHPQSNVIYRTIGDKSSVDVDLTHAHIAPGEFLLLCSDGLNGMIEDETIQRIVAEALSPQDACAQLVNAVNIAGGDDNITVVIVKPELLVS